MDEIRKHMRDYVLYCGIIGTFVPDFTKVHCGLHHMNKEFMLSVSIITT